MNCKNHSCNSCGNKCGSKHNCHSADMVEVVRCKDCRHRNPMGSKCLRDNLWHYDEDYCSYGERKQNEQR